jgi:hypothetical protein
VASGDVKIKGPRARREVHEEIGRSLVRDAGELAAGHGKIIRSASTRRLWQSRHARTYRGAGPCAG